MEIAYKSDIGQAREKNEDAVGYFLNQDNQALLILCDGMGGHQAGDVAASIALNQLGAAWETTNYIKSDEVTAWLKKSIQEQNERIYDSAHKYQDLFGMGTTLVAAVVYEEEEQVIIANVGDSRAYLIQVGEIKQATQDHTWVNELYKNGEISFEEMQTHPRKNILTRSLGTQNQAQVDFFKYHFLKGDYLLLCSDGLTNMLADDYIQDIIERYEYPGVAVEELVNQANKNGGLDNISVLMAYHKRRETD